ncbi:MAG: 1-acyl-sn-glycerol-3-phosphate acyltransferase [Sphingobium sp.]|jgi:1-acyl-sn-glycerol-3-phosphate acyltransferase|nr:1-acyl-sn-glycerol-3-phosphate acyltransferase [Sphingobium sp.]MCI1271066.1 1-acyl-sn-glycerol-3-phosphate acyltransferase [Sphingobium sp.]MCI1755700.1 1-acyl-sn-glycerol-3-phosphate acyltransferase [Sphingobium sp.]MCI2052598.1 1-acyl-sn-glycerol-3-phosphate acyltransferase [Sphingobium sp.]
MNAIPVVALRSALFALLFYFFTTLCVLACVLAAFVSAPLMRRIVTLWGQIHRSLCRYVLGQRIRIVGDLPREPQLYVFKHESIFETIDILCLFAEPVVIAKQELIDIPGWGWVARRHGVIGLRRDDGAKAIRHLRREVGKAVEAGRPICLFPEGTRVPHGERPPLRSGFAGIYQMLGLPVVPVAVDSGLVSPRNSFLKRSGVITYKVGEIIPPGLPRAEAEARAEAAINALNTPTRPLT